MKLRLAMPQILLLVTARQQMKLHFREPLHHASATTVVSWRYRPAHCHASTDGPSLTAQHCGGLNLPPMALNLISRWLLPHEIHAFQTYHKRR